MAKIYFTIAGTNHYHGSDFMKKGMRVELTKEPDGVICELKKKKKK